MVTERAACTARTVARAVASAAMVASTIMPRLLPARPVPRLNRVSPSDMVCTGLMLRARPSCAAMARRCACAFGQDGIGGHDADGGVGARQQGLGRLAAQQGAARVAQARPSSVRAPAITCAVSGSIIAQGVAGDEGTHRHTIHGDGRRAPTPPFMACWMPNTLPTTAPAPAPTLPSAGSALDAAAHAA